MEGNSKKISICRLSDQEVLDLIYNEYMRIKPRNHKEFYEKNILPSLPILQRKLNMKYTEIILKSGVPIELINSRKPDEYYLNKLKNLAIKIGHAPTIEEIKISGMDPTIYIQRFGSYNKAVEIIGLVPNTSKQKKKEITKRRILKDYKEISEKLGKPATEKDFINAKLPYSIRTVKSRLCNFSILREMAGYPKESRGTNRNNYSKEIILEILAKAFIQNGGPLTVSEIENNKELPCATTIRILFKTTKFTTIWEEVSLRAIDILKIKSNSYKENEKIISAGKKGESNVAHNLNFLNKNQYIVYNDINIYSPINDATQQIDHLIIGPNGVFSIETKYLKGNVVVRNQGTWERYFSDKYDCISNPTQQVIRHENQLKSILPQNVEINSVIVMGNHLTKVNNKELCRYSIVNVNEILQFIQNHKSEEIYSERQLKEIDSIIKKSIVKDKKCINF